MDRFNKFSFCCQEQTTWKRVTNALFYTNAALNQAGGEKLRKMLKQP